MRITRVAGWVVLAVTAALTAGIPPSAAAEEPTLTLELSRGQGIYWDGIGPDQPADTVVVSGVLTDAGGTPIAGAEVELFRAVEIDEEFDLLAMPTTDAEGRYRVVTRVVGNSYHQSTYEHAPDQYVGSEVGGLSAMRDLNVVRDRVDGRVLMRGRVRPGWQERPVHLQRRVCGTCAWQDLRAELTGPRAGFVFRLARPARDGATWSYRAWTVRNERFQRSFGAVLRVPG